MRLTAGRVIPAAEPRLTHDNPDWYTPTVVVELARTLLKRIDLDPATDAEANLVIKATTIYTVAEDGLRQPWTGRVFLNPPGGEHRLWWQKLVTEFAAQHVTEAVWVGYSLEQLQTLQRRTPAMNPLTAAGFCVPRARLHFVENAAMRARRVARLAVRQQERLMRGETFQSHRAQYSTKGREIADAPTHANYLTYLGPHGKRFRELFQSLGQCR